MGFMDKVKASVKSVDEKLGNAIDCEKLDSKIRDEEKKIKDLTVEAGEKVIACLRSGDEITKEAFDEIYEKIKECETNIKDLKAQKDDIKIKECDSKIEKLENQKEEISGKSTAEAPAEEPKE